MRHNHHTKTKTGKTIFLMAGLLLFPGLLLFAQPAKGLFPYVSRAHSMFIEGTSNLHDWQTKVIKANLTAEFALENNLLNAIGEVVLVADAKSIKSDKGSVMDGKTHDALKVDKHPTITFRLKQIQSLASANRVTEIRTVGNLTIAGVTRPITMTVFAKLLPNGEVEVWGSQKLKMTDFKVDPPTALMGSIRTGDEIIVRFDLILKKQ